MTTLRFIGGCVVAGDDCWPGAEIVVEDGRITLRMPQDWAALASDRLLNRVRGLGRVVGLDGRIEIGGN